MSDQKGVAPHLRKKAHEKKSTNRPSSIAPATNRANPTNSATNRASPIVPSGNTAHPTVPDIQALNSIARVASARKSSVTTANDAPIKTTRITVDPRVFSDDSAANHDTYHDSTAEAALTDHSLTNDLSDSNASPTLQSTPANAVVLYGIQQTLSPMEMIQHETVRTLQSLLDAVQAQLNATNARCGQLSAENEDLRRQISERVQDSEEPENSGILGETLVGYESSEVAEDEVVSDGKHHSSSHTSATLTIGRSIGRLIDTSSAI